MSDIKFLQRAMEESESQFVSRKSETQVLEHELESLLNRKRKLADQLETIQRQLAGESTVDIIQPATSRMARGR